MEDAATYRVEVKNAYGQASSFAKVLVRSKSPSPQQSALPLARLGELLQSDSGKDPWNRGIWPGVR